MKSTKSKINKIDYKKELKHLYTPSHKQPEIIDVPEMKFIMLNGEGNPNTSEDYQNAIQVLYGLSYTLKFMFKKDPDQPFDYTVLPLEGLWYADDYQDFKNNNKDKWKWTAMIMQPDKVTNEMFAQAKKELIKKKNPPAIDKAYLQSFHESTSAQIMHIGPYDAELPTIEKLHNFIQENGYIFNGEHHEIYLGDPRRSAPGKLKTIIRHPIKKA